MRDSRDTQSKGRERRLLRRVLWCIAAIVYVGFSVTAGLWAYHLYPQEHSPRLIGGTYFVLKIPHGSTSSGVSVGQTVYTQSENDRVTGHRTIVALEIDFSKAKIGSDVTVAMTYPKGAKFLRCAKNADDPDVEGEGETVLVSCRNEAGSDTLVPDVSAVTKVAKPDPKNGYSSPYVFVAFSFAGDPGIDVATGDGQVLAVLPHVEGQSRGTGTTVAYLLDTDEQFDWAGRAPDARNAEGYDVWLQTYAESTGPSTEVEGLDRSHQDRNSRNTFLSGVLAGFAAAALVALVQHLFGLIDRDRRRTDEVHVRSRAPGGDVQSATAGPDFQTRQ